MICATMITRPPVIEKKSNWYLWLMSTSRKIFGTFFVSAMTYQSRIVLRIDRKMDVVLSKAVMTQPAIRVQRTLFFISNSMEKSSAYEPHSKISEMASITIDAYVMMNTVVSVE